MSDQTFGAWLLEQTGRQDTTGTLARAWKQLRDVRGYVRQHTVKTIGQLMSAQLGEDWQKLNGDAAIAAAEREWKSGATVERANSEQTTIFDLPAGVVAPGPFSLGAPAPDADDQLRIPGYPGTGAPSVPTVSAPIQRAILVVDGTEFELTPGRRYTLSLGAPVLRDVSDTPGMNQLHTALMEVGEAAEAAGVYSWSTLYGRADRTVPDDADSVSLGLPED